MFRVLSQTPHSLRNNTPNHNKTETTEASITNSMRRSNSVNYQRKHRRRKHKVEKKSAPKRSLYLVNRSKKP